MAYGITIVVASNPANGCVCFRSERWPPWASPGRWGRCVRGDRHACVWGVWGAASFPSYMLVALSICHPFMLPFFFQSATWALADFSETADAPRDTALHYR
eukprot:COSAG02_NODE_3758_length_6273_cov_8.454810_10_plen_101_part_00